MSDDMKVLELSEEEQSVRDKFIYMLTHWFGPILGLIAIWAFFAITAGKDFVDLSNQQLIVLQTVVVGTAAVGATMIIISGGIDLSIGASIALTTMTVAWLLDKGYSPALAFVGGIFTGMLVGFTIGSLVIGHIGRVGATVGGIMLGLWIASTDAGWLGGLISGFILFGAVIAFNEIYIKRVPISSFIVTLGMWGALRGVAKWVGNNEPIYPENRGWVGDLMAGVPIGDSGFALPAPGVWIMIISAVIMVLILTFTKFGRYAFAIGSNEKTALLCGINIRGTQLWIYTLAIAFGGLAGILQFAFLSTGDPTTADGYELQVIAAVVIGGASLLGGEGSVLGTIVGALIMTVVANGCTKLGLENYVQQIVTGAIIVSAVGLEQWRHGAKYAR
ncbi:Ribose transport system permease protein RbsC [Poriferisphaera corsica]|uniref:Ribose transport system permease protein RbsC n=1 Tax=Poriferisphaera corsica TaxID=2528020 RepID=A0A517YT40_9BACT|nr:ABC transporter permease [Poriferisphaera corsica]QDU33381.1 Ribose transport system permease protein RbsC [Poriferisphaera corsica]